MINVFSLTWLDYVFILAGLLALLYFYLTKNFNYFEKKGIPYEKPYPLLGSMGKLFLKKLDLYTFNERLYDRSQKNNGISGMFDRNKPVLVLGSPDLVKLATVKDFDHFTDHRTIETKGNVFEKNLLALKGLQWKNMRSTLSPAFTASKLRIIFELIDKCAEQIDTFLMKEFDKQRESGQKEILIKQEFKELFTRFTNDAIATSAFGIEINSLADPQNDFFLMGKTLTDLAGGWQTLKFLIAMSSTFLFKVIYNSEIFDPVAINYFRKIIQENLEKRRKEKIIRPDIIHLLLEAQANKSNPQELTDDDILAQAILFFFGGFETVSTTLSLAAHQLAEYPEVQEKLIEEIDQKLKETNGVITYDILMKEMPYLNMVLDETQRRIPAAAATDRVCTKRYTFPAEGNRPEYTINPGQQIWIPLYGFHRDAKYFPNPDKLIPERWSDESQHNNNVFMPFGVGPRMCIANRFARMETKLALFYILKNCRLVFIEETKNPIPFEKGFGVKNAHGFWLGIKPRH